MNKKYLYMGIAFVSVILAGFLIWTLFISPAEDGGNPDGNGQYSDQTATLIIPDDLIGAEKLQEQSGPAAIQAISQMHKSEIDVLNAYIVTYGKGDTQITLWLSLSPTEQEAAYLFQVMDEKVPASQVFTGRQPVNMAGREVIKVDGMGQEHYYWQEGKINYWVAIQGAGDHEALVQEVINEVR